MLVMLGALAGRTEWGYTVSIHHLISWTRNDTSDECHEGNKEGEMRDKSGEEG